MAAYELEKFDASGQDSARRSEQARRIDAARQEGFEAGFLRGEAEATERHLGEQSNLTSELIEAINDTALTNEAARRHVLASIAPTVEAVIAAILPALAEIGVADEVARRVQLAIEAAPEARPRVRCAPEVAETLAPSLEARGCTAEIDAVPTLMPREAEVHWDQGFDHIDLDACIAEIRAVLASHMKPQDGSRDDDGQCERPADT